MFDQMLGKLQDLQQRMDSLKKRLDNVTVTAEAEGVVATMNGNKKLVNISISDALIASGDKEQIEDLITIAINRVSEKAQDVADAEGSAIGRDLVPGFPGMA